MPVEIRELIINVEVDAGKGQASDPDSGQSAGSAPSGIDKDAIVSECVEKVMEILEMKKER